MGFFPQNPPPPPPPPRTQDPKKLSPRHSSHQGPQNLSLSTSHYPIMVDPCVPRRILGVIPARYASSRFPGKALATLGSKTMLQHVWERVNMARYLTDAVIATDDQRIYDAARGFGAAVKMTRSDHVSGTDRVAEVASTGDAELIVNIQGDEPLIDPAAIDAAILPLTHEPARSEE